MLKTSEYVSVGHPDKVADYISCYILDRYMERDPNTRYALEVQIKDHYVSLAGEITSTADFTPLEIEHFVKEAVEDIGYTSFYQRQWGKENTICAKDLKVTQHISQQSPDIARGVDAEFIIRCCSTIYTNFVSEGHVIQSQRKTERKRGFSGVFTRLTGTDRKSKFCKSLWGRHFYGNKKASRLTG